LTTIGKKVRGKKISEAKGTKEKKEKTFKNRDHEVKPRRRKKI